MQLLVRVNRCVHMCVSVCPGMVVSRLAQSQRWAVLQSEGMGWVVLQRGV